MRNKILILTATGLATLIFAIACNSNSKNSETNKVPQMDSIAMVERGSYLVNTMGCDDCHSPKRMGAHGPEIIPELRFSGFPHDGKLPAVDSTEIQKGWTLMAPDLTGAVGPWGASFGANITSDDTGIGAWSEKQFMKALREGKLKGLDGSRPLLPPMPWMVYKNLTDNDLKSIFAYLKTTTPVKNVVPAPKSLAALQ